MSNTMEYRHNGATLNNGTPSQNSFEIQDDFDENNNELLESISEIKQQRDILDFDQLCDKLADLKADFPHVNISELWDEISQGENTLKNVNVSNFCMLLEDEIKENFSNFEEFSDDDEHINNFLPYEDDEDDSTDHASAKRKKKKAARKLVRTKRKTKRKAAIKKVTSKVKKAAKTVTSKVASVAKKVGKSALEAVFMPLQMYRGAMRKQLESRGYSVPKKVFMIDLATDYYNKVIKGDKNNALGSDLLNKQWYVNTPEYNMTIDEFEESDNIVSDAIDIAIKIVKEVKKAFDKKKEAKAEGKVKNERDYEEAEQAELIEQAKKMNLSPELVDEYIEKGKNLTDLLTDKTGSKEKAQNIAMKIEHDEIQKSKSKSESKNVKYILIAVAAAVVLYMFVGKKS